MGTRTRHWPRLDLVTLILPLCVGIGSLTACEGPVGPVGEPGLGDPGEEGQKGDPGAPAQGDASINAVIPLQVFLDRVKQVTISGTGTAWTRDAEVDFGADVEVLDVTVATPSSILATVSVPADAAIGPRTITVTDGDSETTFGGDVFEVVSPLRFTILNDDSAFQGSVTGGLLEMLDASTPFNTEEIFVGFDVVHAVMMRDGEQLGVEGLIFDKTPYTAYLSFYIDVHEALGPVDIEVTNNNLFYEVESFLPAAFEIEARDPIAITTPTVTQAVEANETHLFSFESTGAAEILVTLTPDEQATIPWLSILPGSGKFEDALPSGYELEGVSLPYQFPDQVFFVTPAADTFYAITQNPIVNPVPHNVELGVNIHPVTVTAVAPPTLQAGAIAMAGDAAFYTFDAQAGQTLYAAVGNGSSSTCATDLDSFVQLFTDQGLVFLGAHDDNDIGAPDLCSTISGPLPATGTYYLRLSGAPKCAGCTFDYELFINLL